MVDAQRLGPLFLEAVHLESVRLDRHKWQLVSEECDDRCVVECVDQVPVVVQQRQLADDAPGVLARENAERLAVESPGDWRLLRAFDVALEVLRDLVRQVDALLVLEGLSRLLRDSEVHGKLNASFVRL